MYHVYFIHDNDVHVMKRPTLREAEWDLMVHQELHGNKAWATHITDDGSEVPVTATRSSQPPIKSKQLDAFTTA